jgi:hypothetical protein
MTRPWRLPSVLALVTLVSVSACATAASLDEVMKDPSRYQGRRVVVGGIVTTSGSIAGRGLYQIQEGQSQLWVASDSGVPAKGTRVLVDGRIYDAYDVRGLPLPLPDVVAHGVVLLETSRAVQ